MPGQFYKAIDVPLTKKELLIYREICLKIWGAVPYDYIWAIETKLYINALEKHQKALTEGNPTAPKEE